MAVIFLGKLQEKRKNSERERERAREGGKEREEVATIRMKRR